MRFTGFFLWILMVGYTFAEDVQSPRIIIVGAGASGIAAAASLFEKGFNNVTLLEAENRIGGRINTIQFGDYLIDLGAQWVHGQVNNVVYEKVAPLGLLENSSLESQPFAMHFTNGELVDQNLMKDLFENFVNTMFDKINDTDHSSLGELVESQLLGFFSKHPEINETLQESFKWSLNLLNIILDPADNWYDIGIDPNYETCGGDRAVNWKDKGYGTFLDVLMKKIPDPTEELPIRNNTILNSEVATIDHTAGDGTVKVITTDGREFTADHVIVTVSLGVLKEKHETMFRPPLPQTNVDSIKGLSFGTVAKVFLLFEEPWWTVDNFSGFVFLRPKAEREEIENSHPDTKWMLNVVGFFFVIHKPRLLQVWVAGKSARDIDDLTDAQIVNPLMTYLREKFGDRYNITDPVAMTRSKWYSNPHFRGSYSYHNPKAIELKISPEQLITPILKGEKPVICFAGEATSVKHYSNVHGAVETGWREAERLASFYPGINVADEKSVS